MIPVEIFGATTFLLDRGVEDKVKLTETHDHRSPLVQGGLEIPCKLQAGTKYLRKTIVFI